MIEKITNIHTIPEDSGLGNVISLTNHNFTEIKDRVGLQFTTERAVVKTTDWFDNDIATIPDLEDPNNMVPNNAKIPKARAFVTVEVPAPHVEHVMYTDVIVSPHHEDTDKFASQLQEITICDVLFVGHTSLENIATQVGPEKVKVHLMFWALSSKPMIDLDFDITLV